MVELRQKYTIRLRQEALENGLLRFLRGETQRLQLQQLIPGDLADGGLVDQLRVGTVGGCLLYTSDAADDSGTV